MFAVFEDSGAGDVVRWEGGEVVGVDFVADFCGEVLQREW